MTFLPPPSPTNTSPSGGGGCVQEMCPGDYISRLNFTRGGLLGHVRAYAATSRRYSGKKRIIEANMYYEVYVHVEKKGE